MAVIPGSRGIAEKIPEKVRPVLTVTHQVGECNGLSGE